MALQKNPIYAVGAFFQELDIQRCISLPLKKLDTLWDAIFTWPTTDHLFYLFNFCM